MAAQGPFASQPTGMKGNGYAMPGRKYFWLREHIDDSIRYIELGILFVLPIIVAFFSKKYALAIVALEVSSYYIGMLICDFDQWYNRDINVKQLTLEEELPNPNPPTELDAILDRLHDFEYEYPMNLDRMYYFVLNNQIPYSMDNLDWLEMVSLLNRLSLCMSKQFEAGEETKE